MLNRLGPIRPHLCLAVSLIDHLDPTYGDAPIGIDSPHHKSAIFVSGVFCKVALMSLLGEAAFLVPDQFSVYHFGPLSVGQEQDHKIFYPKTGFRSDTEAVGITTICSLSLAGCHEGIAQNNS